MLMSYQSMREKQAVQLFKSVQENTLNDINKRIKLN